MQPFFMLEGLEILIKSIESFSFTETRDDALQLNKDKIADLQASQWGETSTDANNEPIQLFDNPEYGYGYRPFTMDEKERRGIGLGRVISRVTLFQTGELYKELFVSITQGKVFISSRVEYFKKLMIRTEDPTGLNDDNRLVIAEGYVLPHVKEKFEQATGLIL